MTHEIHLTAEEVAEACRQYAQKMAAKWTDVETDCAKVYFDVKQADLEAGDPLASLRGALVHTDKF